MNAAYALLTQDGRREMAAQVWDEWIADRVANLLETDYRPFDADNFQEATSEIQDWRPIIQLISRGNHQGAGLALEALVKEYWERLATSKAEVELLHVRASACAYCGGGGCPHCAESEDSE